jgi:serine phosphatase RsbU (regulator of sigma subunit)
MSPGDILVLYTDGVYDGSDKQALELLAKRFCASTTGSRPGICNALLDHAVKQDDLLRQNGDEA